MVAKKRDQVVLSFLAPAKGIPDRLKLKECSLKYQGEAPSRGLLTGIYGPTSKQTALVSASKWARENSAQVSRVVMIDVNYRVDEFHRSREQAREDTIEANGWLHLDRISASYRDELVKLWVKWIASSSGASKLSLQNKDYLELAREHPSCITRMFEEIPALRCVVHPVVPLIDETVVLWAATFRYEPDRLTDAEARFLPDVKVIV